MFFTPSKAIPNLMFEIGRLREITFREVGEGTNESIDLDAFDGYYHHLFLWDNEAEKLVGAYRMGLGKNIYKKLVNLEDNVYILKQEKSKTNIKKENNFDNMERINK